MSLISFFFFLFFYLHSIFNFPDAAPKAPSIQCFAAGRVEWAHWFKVCFMLLKKKTATERACAELQWQLRFAKGANLLYKHSLVRKQFQLNPAPFWRAQVGKLLQHVNIWWDLELKGG